MRFPPAKASAPLLDSAGQASALPPLPSSARSPRGEARQPEMLAWPTQGGVSGGPIPPGLGPALHGTSTGQCYPHPPHRVNEDEKGGEGGGGEGSGSEAERGAGRRASVNLHPPSWSSTAAEGEGEARRSAPSVAGSSSWRRAHKVQGAEWSRAPMGLPALPPPPQHWVCQLPSRHSGSGISGVSKGVTRVCGGGQSCAGPWVWTSRCCHAE